MRLFGIILSFVILLGSGILITPQTAHACSCASPESPEQQVREELEHKSAIFAGTVEKVTPPWFKILKSSADPVKVTFKVSAVWKGELGRQVIVYTARDSASCGVDDFQVGTEYIVSASLKSKSLETNICALTKPLASAEAELAVLGEGYPPTAKPFDQIDLSPMSIIVAIATILFGSFIVIKIIRHRRKYRV
ncbi:hypothetical protein [Cohnella luojiensis]|uniref:Tissue inhibitor of metalloproteinase n=1 Tax=Cohnella luojiensis TaxID=652876 RepID=A0A4Y8LUE9_9BACL|nr:hypothetical protein [Cohnella luojiensis]TFE19877.1 hypothetical protein E2980_21715 [Cohnella luojiensis]